MSVEDIVRSEWERDHEKKGVPLLNLRKFVKQHVDLGGQVVRLRNSLFLLRIDEGSKEAKFVPMTADVTNVFLTMLQLFALGLAKSRGVEELTVSTDENAQVVMMQKLFGDDYVSVKDAGTPEKQSFNVTTHIGEYYRANLKASEAEKGSQ